MGDAAHTIRVRVLGGFGVEVDGRPLSDDAWRQQRAAALVKMLALAPAHRLPRDHVVDALWPDLAPPAGAANLRKAAHHARRALGLADGVVLAAGTVALLPDGAVDTDAAGFESTAAGALAAGDAEACRAAAERYAGELLPDDRYAEWCASARDQLRQRYLAVLAGGRLWERLLEQDPLDERAHREVIRGHLDAGDRPAAIRQFDRLRMALREELGVSPDSESVALYEQVLTMEGPDAPTPAERARALLAWGVVHWERADLDEAERAAGEARALAIDAGLGRELADASELAGLVAYAQGRWRSLFARTFLDALERSPDLAPFVLDANMCMSEFALEEADGVRATAELAEDLLSLGDRADRLQARGLGLLLRGESALLGATDPARARADLTEAATVHATAESVTGRALATERLAQVEAACGDGDAARRLHGDALRLAEVSPVPSHLLLFVYGGMLDADDPPAATRIIDEAEAAAAGVDVCDPCSMPFRVRAATACARAGDVDRARGHLAEAARIAQMWRGGPWHAAVAEARAAVRLAEGAGAGEAAGLLHEAADGFLAADRPRDAARCRAAATALV